MSSLLIYKNILFSLIRYTHLKISMFIYFIAKEIASAIIKAPEYKIYKAIKFCSYHSNIHNYSVLHSFFLFLIIPNWHYVSIYFIFFYKIGEINLISDSLIFILLLLLLYSSNVTNFDTSISL